MAINKHGYCVFMGNIFRYGTYSNILLFYFVFHFTCQIRYNMLFNPTFRFKFDFAFHYADVTLCMTLNERILVVNRATLEPSGGLV